MPHAACGHGTGDRRARPGIRLLIPLGQSSILGAEQAIATLFASFLFIVIYSFRKNAVVHYQRRLRACQEGQIDARARRRSLLAQQNLLVVLSGKHLARLAASILRAQQSTLDEMAEQQVRARALYLPGGSHALLILTWTQRA